MSYEIKAINELIKHRRSIFPKQFTPDGHVEDAIVKQMLENANWAPSHHLTEPWRFKVYTGDSRETFANLVQSIYKEYTLPEKFDQSKADKMRDNAMKSTHIIVIIMKRATTGKVPPLMEEEAAVACAVQNMYLTASANGVGCFWSTGGVTYMEAAKPHFGLAPEDKIMGFMYIGQYDGEWPSGHRKPIDEKVEWHS